MAVVTVLWALFVLKKEGSESVISAVCETRPSCSITTYSNKQRKLFKCCTANMSAQLQMLTVAYKDIQKLDLI